MTELLLSKISPDLSQPRKDFGGMNELVESIRLHGLLEPLKVVKEAGGYLLVDGERRFKALQALGRKSAECIVLRVNDNRSRIALQLVFDVQKKNLESVEKAQAFAQLIGFGWNQTKIAEAVGVSVKTVQNYLNLLEHSEGALDLVKDGVISATTLLKKVPKYKQESGEEARIVEAVRKRKNHVVSKEELEEVFGSVRPVQARLAEFRSVLACFNDDLGVFLADKALVIPVVSDVPLLASMGLHAVDGLARAWEQVCVQARENLVLLESVRANLGCVKTKVG